MNSSTKERCIAIARQLMPLYKSGRSFHVSFLLNKRKILFWATNDYTKNHQYHIFGKYLPTKSNTDEGNYIPVIHSEIAVIKRYIQQRRNSDFSGLTLFNVRIGCDGQPMIAKPCKNCERIVYTTNLKEIVWTE